MKLKKGDKLYIYVVDLHLGKINRDIYTYTIKQVIGTKIYTYDSLDSKDYIRQKDIGIKFFLSKKEMYEYQFKLQRDEYELMMIQDVEPMKKEIIYLKRRIRKCKK